MEVVKTKYKRVIGTHLDEQSVALYDLELTESLALVFGNEHDGISEAVLPWLDGNFIIPQLGMIQSLNISVACAITLYECFRQRQNAGKYQEPQWSKEAQDALFQRWTGKKMR
jgi:tRNA (guanosine-2'-O-)-methyltransferase